jgi:methylphosphotriester-DNA--protein-cysteine methyltransferase
MKKLVAVFLSFAFLVMSCGVSFAECKNFVASKDSNKYHTTDCGIAKNIKPGNQACFNTQEEAIKAGYAPCGVCKPDEKIKVVASKDSDKYHLPSCGLVKNIKPENLVEYSSPAEAVKAGKSPCGICKPPKAKQMSEKTEKAEPKADKK